MNNCSNCKYWGDNRPVQGKANECSKIGIDESTSKDIAFVDADADDDSGMRVKFMTRAEFSCSLHSIK